MWERSGPCTFNLKPAVAISACSYHQQPRAALAQRAGNNVRCGPVLHRHGSVAMMARLMQLLPPELISSRLLAWAVHCTDIRGLCWLPAHQHGCLWLFFLGKHRLRGQGNYFVQTAFLAFCSTSER